MTRPLRSLLIGDCDYYFSPYIFGVAQACGRLGVWHSQISIRAPKDVIWQRIADVRPDVLWTHMFLWAPAGSPKVDDLVSMAEKAHRKLGVHVIIHDGDYKDRIRHPVDLSAWCSVALCNHQFDRSVWGVPTIHWPYFAFMQERIADPDPAMDCDIWFAGTIGMGPVYEARTKLIEAVRRVGMDVRMPKEHEGNTLLRTAEIAASAGTVLGFGRPGVAGWVDTRVFQYPGAGGILLHDDVGGFLEPWVHYAPYESGNANSVVGAARRVRALPLYEQRRMRNNAFAYVQGNHSSVSRVKQVLQFLELRS